MPDIDKLRAGLRDAAIERTERPAWLSLAITAGVAFAVGVLLVVGWTALPPVKLFHFANPLQVMAAPISSPASANRLGRPSTAPILARCIRAHDPDYYDKAPADLLYTALKGGTTQSRMRSTFGKPSKDQARNIAEHWASLANCVYHEHPNALCDPDSRALAVESAMMLMRQPTPVAAPGDDLPDIDVAFAKEQVLSLLKSRLQDGVLIAADFGFFPPGEIRRVAGSVSPARNICPSSR